VDAPSAQTPRRPRRRAGSGSRTGGRGWPLRTARTAGAQRRRRRRARGSAGGEHERLPLAPRRGVVRERLIESRLTPNAISLTGLALNVLAAVLVWEQLFFVGGIAFIVGSIMDTLDGRYSRMSGKGTPFGAFLDSTLDRVEEGIVLAAVAGRFAAEGRSVASAAVVIAVLASLMVSYTRARAEALGVACKVGLAQRAVRVVILSVGLVFARGASLGHFSLLAPAVYVLAALSVITVLQRIWHVRRELTAREA
jgi:CDP-diacylglycerol--glycerol-3-phosphate 3-phosphatidyltransferase